MAAVWAAGPEPIIATEVCILRREWEKVKVGGAVVVVVVAVCGRIVDAARSGRVAEEERRVVKRLKAEENVVADWGGVSGRGR